MREQRSPSHSINVIPTGKIQSWERVFIPRRKGEARGGHGSRCVKGRWKDGQSADRVRGTGWNGHRRAEGEVRLRKVITPCSGNGAL